jgi:hypothetical protein
MSPLFMIIEMWMVKTLVLADLKVWGVVPTN